MIWTVVVGTAIVAVLVVCIKAGAYMDKKEKQIKEWENNK